MEASELFQELKKIRERNYRHPTQRIQAISRAIAECDRPTMEIIGSLYRAGHRPGRSKRYSEGRLRELRTFGKFLIHCSMTDAPDRLRTLNEKQFRTLWVQTEHNATDEARRAAVLDILQHPNAACTATPKTKIFETIIANFGDANWYHAEDIGKAVDIGEDAVVILLGRRVPGYQVELKPNGLGTLCRITEDKITTSESFDRCLRHVDLLIEEGKKDEYKICAGTVARLATLIKHDILDLLERSRI